MSKLNSFKDLRIEVANQRLAIRAILAYLAFSSGKPAAETICTLASMLEGVGPYSVPANNMDPELRKAAMDRAKKRMSDFLVGIAKVPIMT
jgi:hypothetical protein